MTRSRREQTARRRNPKLAAAIRTEMTRAEGRNPMTALLVFVIVFSLGGMGALGFQVLQLRGRLAQFDSEKLALGETHAKEMENAKARYHELVNKYNDS